MPYAVDASCASAGAFGGDSVNFDVPGDNPCTPSCGADSNDPPSMSIQSASSDDGDPVTRALSSSFDFVDDVRTTHGRILVVDRAGQHDELLAIYDAASFDLVEVILCRDLALSPSGRFAVFERFFARMASRLFAYHVTAVWNVCRWGVWPAWGVVSTASTKGRSSMWRRIGWCRAFDTTGRCSTGSTNAARLIGYG